MKSMKVSELISWAVSLLILAAILAFTDIGEILRTVASVGWPWFLALNAFFAAGYLLRGIKWNEIIRPIHRIPHSMATRILLAGFFLNNILPLRAGEFARAVLLAKKTNTTKSTALSTVVVDRITDVIALLLITLASMMFFPFPPYVLAALLLLGILSVAAVGIMIHQNKALLVLEKKARWIPPTAHRILRDLLKSGESLAHPNSFRVWLYSLLIWIHMGLFYWLAGMALGIPLTFPQSVFLSSLVALFALIPAAPGQLGTLEAATGVGMEMLGYGFSAGISFGIITHIIFYGSTTLLGLYVMPPFTQLLRGEKLGPAHR
ncbi:MAG: flippase-like domain-containing protein [Candidatus Diapherotrites archaeon]|nr:flippase-like domain-containing protein [Candidatus Diapherotrites archaeon]